jgi:hypothetical protein
MLFMFFGIAAIACLLLYVGFRVPDRAAQTSGRSPAFITEPQESPVVSARGRTSNLTSWGWVFIVLGLVVVAVSAFLDISVESTSYVSYSAVITDVVNIALVARRAMVFEAGLALTIIGTVVACAGHVINSLRRD